MKTAHVASDERALDARFVFDRWRRAQNDPAIVERLGPFHAERDGVAFLPNIRRICVTLVKQNNTRGNSAEAVRTVCANESNARTVLENTLGDALLAATASEIAAYFKERRRIQQSRQDLASGKVFRVTLSRKDNKHRATGPARCRTMRSGSKSACIQFARIFARRPV